MDRQQAAVHYIEQAEIAMLTMLQWCDSTYQGPAADKVARMFLDILYGENLLNYCELTEVLALWGSFSRKPMADKVYGGEFIIALNQHFCMFVEPAVIASGTSLSAVTNLSPLGAHLVGSIARAHPLVKDVNIDDPEVRAELESYNSYFQDIPKPDQIVSILSMFPWMAPLYLLTFSNSITLKTMLATFTFEPGAQPEAGAQ